MVDNRLARLASEYQHGDSQAPSRNMLDKMARDIAVRKAIAEGLVPKAIRNQEDGLRGGMELGDVGGVPISATDLLPADLGVSALVKGGSALAAKFAAAKAAGLGAVPLMAGTFIGKNAKTFNAETAAKAEQMLKEGKSGAEIWNATHTGNPNNPLEGRTFVGADKKLRQEIDDSGSMYRGVIAGNSAGEAIHHPELFSADPVLRDIKIREFKGSGGSFDPSGVGQINIGVGGGIPNSTVLHELQHAIQQREGFARGGDMRESNVFAAFPEAELLYKKLMESRDTNEIHRLHKELSEFTANPENQFEAYRRLAGESEARLTQSRMNMTPSERAASYPPSMFDVPIEDQIFRYGDNKAMSVKPGSPEQWARKNKSFSPNGMTSKKIGDYTYYIEDAGGGDGLIHAVDYSGRKVGDTFFGEGDIPGFINGSVGVDPEFRRRGIASTMYKLAEDISGKKIIPETTHTADAEAFWNNPKRNFGLNKPFSEGIHDVEDPAIFQAYKDKLMDVDRPRNFKGEVVEPTEAEIRHAVAMYNASLPIEHGGLGLDAGNTAMDRAVAGGFNTPAYHGTNADIKSADYANSGIGNDQYGSAALYTGSAPEIANQYVKPIDIKSGGNVIPLILNTKGYIESDKANNLTGAQIKKIINSSPDDDALYNFGDISSEGKDKVLRSAVKRYQDYARPKLLDNLHMLNNDFYADSPELFNKNAGDILGISGINVGFENGNKFHLAWNPSDIRSRFAAFDPAQKKSANILAQYAAITPVAYLAEQALAAKDEQ